MRLFVARHGEAEPCAFDDACRSLTLKGQSQITELWQVLSQRGVAVKRVVASPFKRTQQTARLITQFYPQVAVESQDCLLSEGNPRLVFEWLMEQPQDDGLVLVSHMPLVAILVGMLTDSAGARMPFSPGMVASIDMEVAAVAGGRLRWCISPEIGVTK